MTIFECIAEQRIVDALSAGSFDQLAGRGERLNLEEDDAVQPEWRAAFRLLKNAGLAPEWVGLGREIDAGRARLQSALANGEAADADLLAEVAALNRRIDDFNLVVPHASLQKLRLRVRRDLNRGTGS
jgi:hypothetical protein